MTDPANAESLSYDGARDLPPGLVALSLVKPGLPGQSPTARGEPPERDISTIFDEHDRFAHTAGYSVKDAAHPDERLRERTPLPAAALTKVERQVAALKLPPGNYHVPLRQKGVVVGYAAFKGVPGKPRPVLSTVLGPMMTPRGENIEARLKAASEFTTDQLDPRLPEQLATLIPNHPRAGMGVAGREAVDKAFDDFAAFGDTVTTNTQNDQMGGDALNDVKAAAAHVAALHYGVP